VVKFGYNGAEIRESARARSRRMAAAAERQRHSDLERGIHRIPTPKRIRLLSVAARE
jgi:hypothetical protein